MEILKFVVVVTMKPADDSDGRTRENAANTVSHALKRAIMDEVSVDERCSVCVIQARETNHG